MEPEKLIFFVPLSLLGILAVAILIFFVKKNAYLKGYKQAEFDITSSMFDKATWFSSRPIFYNTLFLFAARYRKYGHVSADKFRHDILTINHENRITDLTKEEQDILI